MKRKMNKRLGIFAIYDREGILDRYIFYLLDSIVGYLDTLVIACNGNVKKEYIDRLRQYTDKIYLRENVGYDFGAYKETLLSQIEKADLELFDELVLFNDTFFGPFYSFENVFKKMEEHNYDFWGITKHPKYKKTNGDIVPEHVQSYFLVVDKRMFLDEEFMTFFESKRDPLSREETIRNFEIRFTEYFSRRGYKYGVLADMSEYESNRFENNGNFYMFMNYQLLSEMNSPIIKKKSFLSFEYNLSSVDMKKSMEYIEKHTNYDIDLIWENILRTNNISDIQNILQLRYCLEDSTYSNSIDDTIFSDSIIIVYTSHSNQIIVKQFMKFLSVFLELIKVQIVVHSEQEEKLWREINNLKDIEFVYTSLDSSMEFLYKEAHYCFENYEFFCYLNLDVAMKTNNAIFSELENINRVCDNLLSNKIFVKNVLGCFVNNQRLGLLAPTLPSDYQISMYGKWYSNIENIKTTAKNLEFDINKYIDHRKCSNVEPSCFWARTKALRCLERLNIQSLGSYKGEEYVLEKVLIYLCQDFGFFSGIVENSSWAAVEINSLIRLLRKRELQWNQKLENS